MEHSYIEKDNKKLYYVYHEPLISSKNQTGIVLCYPIGQEYIRCHKACVNLAQKLSLKGFHTIRFDYYGTGDSNGSFDKASVLQWTDDIKLAINELREGCFVSKIVLIGVRFGATLSMLYGVNDIDKMVLWSPILSGKEYLDEMKSENKKWLSGSFAKQKKNGRGSIESLGYLYSKELCKDISKIEIKKIQTKSKTLVIDEKKPVPSILENLTFKEITNKEFWLKRENEEDKSIIPISEIDTITNWI